MYYKSTWYSDIPSPKFNTTVFGVLIVLWPPSNALWGSSVLPYTMPSWCDKEHLEAPAPLVYVKLIGVTVLSVLTMRSLYTMHPHTIFKAV